MFIGIYKLTRMFLATLRGSDTPKQLAVGIALGMLFGLIPKDNLLVVSIGILILSTNCNVLMATLSGFACSWVGLLLDPISGRIGEYLLHHEKLVPTWTYLYELPIVPWTRFNDTVVFGSMVIGLLTIIPVYYLSQMLLGRFGPIAHQRLLNHTVYRWLVGSEKETEQIKSSALRLGWVMPRCLLIIVLFGAVFLFKDRVIQYSIEKSGSAIVGARVEVGQVKSGLLDGRIRLHDLQIANPKSPMENVVRAKYVGMEFSTTALLKKKLIVEEGKMVGLEFNTQRKSSGEIASRPDKKPGIVSKKVNDLGKQWMGDLKSVLDQRIEENLETVQVSKQLLDSWPQEYAALKTRADNLEDKIKNLKKLKDLKFNNPLRDLRTYETAINDVNETHQEILALNQQLQRLRTKFDVDRAALENAKETDKQRIRELVTTSKMSGKSLSELMLGQQQGQRVDQVLGWLTWIRETFPDPETDFQPQRGRGEVILFPNLKQTPDLLVQKLMVHGKGNISDDPYEFRGTILDFCSQPRLHPRPTVINLKAEGQTNATVRAIVDRTTKVRRDTLVIRCPNLQMKGQRLGSDDTLLVSLGPTTSDLLIKVHMIDGKLAGRVTFKQSDVGLNLEQLPSGINDVQVKNLIATELADIDRFQVVLKVSGTLEEPKWSFESDLGDQLADAMNRMLVNAVDQQVAKLNRYVDRVASEKLSELNELVALKHAEIKHILDTNNVDVAELQGLVKRVMDLPLLRR